MKNLIVLLSAFAAVTVQAHVEPGKYVGTTASGAACEMTAGETYFENKVAHPLNERIEIQYNGFKFLVGHPPVVDVATETAYFNHDIFQSVLPTTTGAQALIIDMVHSETFEGPARFRVIENDWVKKTKNTVVCDNLTHSK